MDMTQDIIVAGRKLTSQQKQFLRPRILAWYLMTEILPNHIGKDNAISKLQLFKKLFKVDYDPEDNIQFYLWDVLKKALHILRKYSKCFVTTEKEKSRFKVYVISNMDEAKIYVNAMENCVKRMRYMEKRAVESVGKGWYKDTSEWKLPTRNNDLLTIQ